MIHFISLGVYIRALFLTVFFVEICFSACFTIWSFIQKKLLPRIISPIPGIIAFIFLLPYSAYILSEKTDINVNYVWVQKMLELPAYVVIAVSVVMALVLLFLAVFFLRKIRTGISAFSVKESVDKLKTGVCFAYKNGMIKLINHKMDELGRIITGKEISNALDFIKILRSGEFQPGTESLSYDGEIILRLPDMNVWRFSVKETGNMYEITASETTDLYRISDEIRESNDELILMNERLIKYGENVDELTKARERLETKYRIHAEFGNALLATRLFLQNNDGNPDEIINIWKRNITVLGSGETGDTEYDAISGLLAAARAVGINVEIVGNIPEKESVKKLFLETTAEALTNAVKHADAKLFKVMFASDIFSFKASFSNDGIKPSENIIEGGGLSSIRRKTELLGGRMSVGVEPVFCLTITVPK